MQLNAHIGLNIWLLHTTVIDAKVSTDFKCDV